MTDTNTTNISELRYEEVRQAANAYPGSLVQRLASSLIKVLDAYEQDHTLVDLMRNSTEGVFEHRQATSTLRAIPMPNDDNQRAHALHRVLGHDLADLLNR